ncbi:uncharacterized protein M6B38_335240 [Iris pallida]|uniref:Uncharacterized protein n=1 Tax=Iris pallida TaxID=29817 RepID=A0AAX6H208_IRIPA|nr:uncharacterized protein M6B38_335240 [Iris pallida]
MSPTEPCTARACCAARTPPWLPLSRVAPGSTSSAECIARSVLSPALPPAHAHQPASARPAARGRSRAPCQHGAAGARPNHFTAVPFLEQVSAPSMVPCSASLHRRLPLPPTSPPFPADELPGAPNLPTLG